MNVEKHVNILKGLMKRESTSESSSANLDLAHKGLSVPFRTNIT